jgi:hypothetical protein
MTHINNQEDIIMQAQIIIIKERIMAISRMIGTIHMGNSSRVDIIMEEVINLDNVWINVLLVWQQCAVAV